MGKQEFLTALSKGLSGLPRNDRAERLAFYSDLIDDQIEEGLSEEEAVAAMAPVEQIVAQVLAEYPAAEATDKAANPKRQLGTGEIILLVLGAPIWLSLAIAVFAVILSLYVCLWSVIISLWAVFGAFAGCSLGGILAGVLLIPGGSTTSGLTMLAAGILFTGLSIFLFFGCKAATKGTMLLTKKTAIWIRHCISKKEAAA